MAQLPPKIPSLPHHNWPPSFPSHQRMPPLTTPHQNQHSPPPQSNANTSPAPSWVDEFLDFTSARRGNHRRSVSDSIAFLEGPHLEVDKSRNSGSGFDRLDDEQLMSMFSDDIAAGMPGMVGPPSSPSDQNSNNDDEEKTMSTDKANNNNENDGQQQQILQCFPKSEPGEVESACDTHSDNNQISAPISDNGCNSQSGADDIIDSKRVKRILANRQSAQRSRVRKLQYISELERSVTTLQTEVSALSPRVAFLDHQRLILNVDNSALKQRIAALAQDKIFKDAHQEALKKEIERLRQIYQQQQQQQQQNLKKMSNSTSTGHATGTLPPTSDHTNMGCTDKEQLMT